jgi:hypothetical protein
MVSQERLNTVDSRLSLPEGNSPEAFPLWQPVQLSLSLQAPAAALHKCQCCSKIIAKVSFEYGQPLSGAHTPSDMVVYNLQIYRDKALEAAASGCQLFQYVLNGYDFDPLSPILLKQPVHAAADIAWPETLGRRPGPRPARPWLLKEHDMFLEWCESKMAVFSLFAPEGLMTLLMCTSSLHN